MRESITRPSGACLALMLIGAQVWAQGEPRDDAPALGMVEALDRTVAGNPELTALGYAVEAAEGRLLQAGLRPNPELGVTVEDALGTNSYRGLDSAEATVTIGWVLERGVRERIVATGRAGLALQNVDVEMARIDAAAETARRFIDCLAVQARLEQAEDAFRLAEETVRRVRERVTAGGALAAELARAEAALARSELQQEEHEHELLSAYRRLAAQWGDAEPDFAAVSGNVETLPQPVTFEQLLTQVDDNPQLARFASQQRVDESQLRLAEARSRPSWRVYAGLRRHEATDDFGIVGGITIPLPLRDRNQGRIAETRAEIARTEAQTAAARTRIETELFALHQELTHDVHLARRLDEDVIPLTQSALADTRRAYEIGRYGYLEWRTVQAELLDALSERLEAAIDAHRIVIEIERLTGTSFESAATAQGGRP